MVVMNLCLSHLMVMNLKKITEIVSKNHIRPLVNERNFKLEDFNEVLDYFLNGKPKSSFFL